MPATSRSQIAFFKIAEWSEVTAAVVRPRRTSLVGKVAKQLGLEEPGYRLLANAGINAHQEVPHLHVHLFGGRHLGPMLAR